MKRFACALLFLLASVANLQAQTPFYQGKTIRIIVGNLAGDAYDLWARIFAQHMGKYIPGNPTFIVQNMTGAGGVVAANYVYTVAKPDGLTLGTFGPSMYFDQLARRPEVQFDWAKFTWLGTPEQTEFILIMRTDTPYQSIEDVRKAAQPPKCGATGTSTSGYYMPKFLDEGLGDQVQHRQRLSRRRRDRPRHRARRTAVPQFDDQHLLRPRAVSDLAQERVCPADPANGQEERSSGCRRSVHL